MLDEGRGFMPLCRRACGCPIEDIATDIEVNNFWGEFSRARGLFDMNGISSLLERKYQELELLDDPQSLFELERLYILIQNKRAKEKEEKDAWSKIIK